MFIIKCDEGRNTLKENDESRKLLCFYVLSELILSVHIFYLLNSSMFMLKNLK